jgi:hypothetical protein
MVSLALPSSPNSRLLNSSRLEITNRNPVMTNRNPTMGQASDRLLLDMYQLLCMSHGKVIVYWEKLHLVPPPCNFRHIQGTG